MIRPDAVVDLATEDDIARYYGPISFMNKWTARVIRKGSLVAAFGGIVEISDGVWQAFFEVPAYLRKPSIFRHILAGFDEAKAQGAREIRAFCNTDIEGAERLMRHLGFRPTDETIEDRTVWKWLISD